MSRKFLILIPVVIILVFGTLFYTLYKASQPSAQIRGINFQLEVVKTDKDKEIGLSKYKSLPEDKGMLFLFDKEGFYGFWMKEMKFPIDIIFIKGDKIVTIYKNAPINNLTIYTPTQASDKVLEVNAGLSKKDGFNVGDVVTLKNVK